jgi:hypothetical protein
MLFKPLLAGIWLTVLSFSGWADTQCRCMPFDLECQRKCSAGGGKAIAPPSGGGSGGIGSGSGWTGSGSGGTGSGSGGTGAAGPRPMFPPPPPSISIPQPPTLPSPPPSVEAPINSPVVLPTRAFLPPHDIPPEDFAAYGIIAFPQKATSHTIRRHISTCEAFVATLPPVSLVQVPSKQQMVTVWPVDSTSLVEVLAKSKPDCKIAVEHYSLPTALTALKQARTQDDRTFSTEGPYLLAWAPSSTKGKRDALILVGDLSDARTDVYFLDYFRLWRNEIEKKPELWHRGWSEPDLLTVIRRWADKWGPKILSLGRARATDYE